MHEQMGKDIVKVLYSQEQIAACTRQMGEDISRDYAGKKLLLVSVLKGAFIFMADLVRSIDMQVEVDFMAVSSYGAESKSSGIVRIIKDLEASIESCHVLVVEDILDSGLTLRYLLKNIKSRGPLSVEVASLLIKDGKQQTDVKCKYVGLNCPDEFLVGYGLDYAENYRNLPYIGILNPAVYTK